MRHSIFDCIALMKNWTRMTIDGAEWKMIFINIERRQSRPIDGVGLRARKTAGFFVIASQEPV
ncbi:hypothetical protein WN48_10977 [Eufriesea mexicana]|uniref:Uncharacterized protein n=1 Tax=Eufriesea mexicana TaxID=516756 RepID=A0A310SS84_9HYME|nr:hypothetical protein WN48_10977 [Eufriesea mexicana]